MTELYYVEDDAGIAGLVKDGLGQRGYKVAVFATIEAARRALEARLPDMVLLDWNMPEGQGGTLCRWIRMRWKELPIIFLTVRSDTQDIVSGFEQGADDYVVKPFELDVLYSRIQALLRRAGNVSGQYLSCGGISMDKGRMLVFNRGEEVTLSQTEYQLLCLLLENRGITVPRESLLRHIWDANENFVNDNTLTVTMKRLREKLNQPSCLKTVRSFGYRMEERDEE